MAKSRSFSIYLLKDGYTYENSLKENHELELLEEHNTNLPDGSIMYIADNFSTLPWWKNYWGIEKELHQVQKGALIFLPIDNKWIALTFGMTHYKLKDVCYEYDFGLRTTLNALDPTKIKSTDILQPENAKRQRIQSPTASSLNFFDIKQDESIIKKLTGSVKLEYNDWFKNVTGASNLKVSSNIQPNEIVNLCRTLIETYNKEDYIDNFPDIRNIEPIRDPIIISNLDEKLIEAFNEAPVDLVLTVPDIIDYSDSFTIKYSGAGKTDTEYSDVFIGGYRQYLEEKNLQIVTDKNIFYKHKLNIINESGIKTNQYDIYKSFLYDCEFEGKTYHLCDGQWYIINSDFIEKLANTLNPHFITEHRFLHACNHKKENEYNISVSDANQDVICLDTKNISPTGQTAVEPCDLIFILDNIIHLVHVKISTRSSNLSHLFNQGINSVELLRMESESKEKLKELIHNNENFIPLIDSEKFIVTYGIITKKATSNLENPSKNLPIFSRISLLRVINTLKMMNIKFSIYFINDNVDRKKSNNDEELQ